MTKTNKILFSALALMLSAVSGVFAVPLSPARSGNTTTVLPNGNILITGGHLGDGTPVSSAVIYISSKAAYESLPNMSQARIEHTATLLPDGRVFVFGGRSTTAASSALRTYTIFDPKTNSFSAGTSLGTSASYRAGHSATLITNGDYKNMVMLCGGYYNSTHSNSTCDIVEFNNGTPSLHTSIQMIGESGQRRDFTATMLSNGNVFITGGRRDTTADTYVQANVSFDVESNTFGTESALVIGRRDHAAVTLNDGRVAVIGGFNEAYTPAFDVNTDDDWYNLGKEGFPEVSRHNPGYHGFLDTVELFDKYGKPTIISGGETGIKTLPYRVANASAILSPGGRVYIYGGRGNIPVTFADIPVEFGENSILKTTGDPDPQGDAQVMSIDQDASHLYFDLEKTTLSRPVSGRIVDGDIFIPTSDEKKHGVKVGGEEDGGIAVSFVGTSKQGYSKEDIRAPLDGLEVGRQYDPDFQSGNIEGKAIKFKDTDGKIFFYPVIQSGLEASYNYVYPRSQSGYPSYHRCSNSDSYLQYVDLFSYNIGIDTGYCYGSIAAGTTRYARFHDVTLRLDIEDLPAIYKGSRLSGSLKIEGFTVERDEDYENDNYPAITVEGLENNSYAVYNFSDLTPTCSAGDGESGGSCTLRVNANYTTKDDNPLIGTIENTDETYVIGQSTITATVAHAAFKEISVRLTIWADQVNLSGESYDVGGSTIVIRDMLFSNNLSYNPKAAKWDYNLSKDASDTLYEFTAYKYGEDPTALVDANMLITASGAPMIIGGRKCNDSSSYCHRLNVNNTYVANKPLYDRSDDTDLFKPSEADMLPAKREYPYGKGAGGELNFPRQGHTATVLPNKKILVCGGSNGLQTLDSCELYNPETGRWDITGSMRTPRSGHTATLLPNGKVILTGGTDGTNLLNSSEVYNPKHEKFDDTVTYMHKTRQNHTATILPNGNVFVAGGSTSTGYELFVTTEAKWIEIYNNAPSLTHHTATLLKNGKVAIIGGLDSTGSPTTSYYICDPVHPVGNVCVSNTGQLKVYMHASVLDKNGNVWVIGGTNGNYPTGKIYKYTINENVFSRRPVGTLPEGITGHTANIGPDNIITIYGGKTPSSAIGYVSYINPDLESLSITAGEPVNKRANHATVLDSEGYYMVIGGDNGLGVNYTVVDRNYFTELPDKYVKEDYTPTRRPDITNGQSENVRPGERLTLLSTNTVHNFHGYTEAGDGSAVYHNTPRVVLQAMDNFSGFLVDISTNFYVPGINNRDWHMMMSSMTAQLPGMVHDGDGTVDPELPWGYYYAIESVNGQFSNFKPVQVGENWELPKISTPVAPLDNDYCHPSAGQVPAPCLNQDYAISAITGYSVYESSVVWRWAPLPDLDGANKYVNGYEVYSATSTETGPSLGRVPIDRANPNEIPVFVSSGLPPNFPARIKVAAFNIWSESEKFAISDTYYTLASSATLDISVSNFETVELSWTSRNYEGTCYQVEWCKSNDVSKDCFLPEYQANKIDEGIFTETKFSGGSCYSSSSYTATGLTPATGYWFRVQAINGTNSSDWATHKHSSGFVTDYSNDVSTITVSSMGEIMGTPTASTITWTWDRIGSGNDTVIYEISEIIGGVVQQSEDYEPEGVDASTTKIEYVMTNTHAVGDSSLKANVGYQIRVTPKMKVEINGVEQIYYGNSKDSPIVYTLANNPMDMELYNGGDGDQALFQSLKVNWQPNGNSPTTVYNIEISTSADFSSIAFSTSTLYGAGGTYTVEGLIPNTYYYGRISALNAQDRKSEYAYFLDDENNKARECTHANLPSNVTVTANSMSGISIAWEHNGNPQVFDAAGVQTGTRYEVSLSTQSTFPTSPLPPYPTRTEYTVETNHRFSGLLTHTMYYIQIQSYNQDDDLTKYDATTFISTVTVAGPGNIDGSVGGTSNPSRDVEISGNFLGQRYVSLFVPAAAYDRETALAIAPYEYKDNRGAGALIPEHWDADFCNQQAEGLPVITAKIFSENPNPKVPVDFTIGYFDPEEAALIENYKDEILLARYNKKTHSCLPLKTLFNQSSKIITASVNTFDSETALPDGSTVIQVIRRAAPSNMNEVKVYPNPMYVSRGDGYVTIEPVPAHTKLTLYTLSGAKIWEGSSDNSFVIVWKGENKYGNPVASGVYLGVLDSPAGKKKIKIAVEK